MSKYIWISLAVVLLACVAFFVASSQLRKPAYEIGEEAQPSDFLPTDPDDGFAGERSGKWPSVRKAYLALHPECEACCSTEDLNVHHVVPFHEDPSLELDMDNLITLCREHHFTIGHDPDGLDGPQRPNWKSSNPNVRRDAAEFYDSALAP